MSSLLPNSGVALNRDVRVLQAMAIAARLNPGRGGVATSAGISQYRAENFKTAPYPNRGELFPFDLTIAPATGNGTFRPGVINGLPPALTLAGIVLTGVRYIILQTTWASGTISSATWQDSATAPVGYPITQGTPPTSLDILTHVVNAGVVFRVIPNGSLRVTPYEAFRTDKATPLDLGVRPWISWYGYTVGAAS